MKKMIATLLITIMVFAMAGCSAKDSTGETSNEKLSVVTTIFPYYDFIRQIAQDKVDITMLVTAGKDSHSFEPTPQDMIKIQQADLFIYNGGEMESWVEQILDAVDNQNLVSDCMFDYVTTLEEEHVEGMEAEHEEEDHEDEEDVEYDEHIWTSPENAKIIVTEIAAELSKIDPDNSEFYKDNASDYLKQLEELDNEFKEVVDNASRNVVLFGDKFPFRYFTEEYGLTYYAAFPGCSTETEPSADTIAFLIKKMETEQIPVVYYTEQSTQKIADTISESTGAKKLLLHSCHNVTKEQFDSGVTYLDLMKQNVKNLKEGLSE